jgi:hypothetical protein
MVAAFVVLLVPEWRVNQGFVEHTCMVKDKQVREVIKPRAEGEKEGQVVTLYCPEIHIEYQVGDATYGARTYDIHCARGSDRGCFSRREDAEAAIGEFLVGRQYPCWYDPADPRVVVLVRGYSWWIWLIVVVPLSFVVIGAGGLVYSALQWGRSAERRAALARQVPYELLEAGGSPPKLPNIPESSEITSSPGTRLAFRLPMSASPAWVLFGLLVASLLWNGAVGTFLVFAALGHVGDSPAWLLTLFTVPFLLIGVALLVLFVRQLLVATAIGPTLVEISDHPLLPGGQYRLFISQSGRPRINSIEVSLVCLEEATYREGTNARTETREVYRQPLLRREAVEIRRSGPLEAECDLGVPPAAMHSFQAGHNEINWKIIVQGEIAGWPGYQRAFPVVIHPGQARTDHA